MTQDPTNPYPPVEVDLKDPALAAFLGWLIPGMGHMYQRRWGKGGLFMICVLGTFFFGMYLGDGKVVYAAWKPDEPRYAYLCQVGVGLPALPAIVQTVRVRGGKDPLWPGVLAPPVVRPGQDELSERHRKLHVFFELGTVYTMIAGLLNILAIYDAWGGPVYIEAESKREKKRPPETGPPDEPPPEV